MCAHLMHQVRTRDELAAIREQNVMLRDMLGAGNVHAQVTGVCHRTFKGGLCLYAPIVHRVRASPRRLLGPSGAVIRTHWRTLSMI